MTPHNQHYGSAIMNLRILAIAALAFVLTHVAAVAQPSSDSFNNVDQIMRFMKSANYSEEDLLRRMNWSDKMVNDLVSYRAADDDRQNYLRLLDFAIDHFQKDNARLRVLLRAVTTLDPLVRKYFPQWVVQDEAMILELMRKIRDNRDDLRDDEAVEIANRVLTGKAKFRVVQKPMDSENLIGIIIERAREYREGSESAGFIRSTEDPDFDDYRIVGRRSLVSVLSQDLYDRVVRRVEYAHLMETGAIKPEPYVAQAHIDIPFGGGFMWTLEADERTDQGVAIQVSRIRAGFELKIGNEWVNLPFLYGPQWNALFVYEPSGYEYIKFGPSIPFTWGDESINSDFPLFKNRRLNGTWGAAGEYHKQLSNIGGAANVDADGIGAAAFVSFGLRTLGNKKITNLNGEIINGDETPSRNKVDVLITGSDNNGYTFAPQKDDAERLIFYHIAATATAYYWRDLGFALNGLRGALGFGYLKVNKATRKTTLLPTSYEQAALTADSVSIVEGKGYLDAYARLEYNHRGKTTYGAAVQYFNGGLMGELYLNIFTWLTAEVRYSRIVFRDPYEWEHEEMIVPGLRMSFAF